jgi:hypothetical protein
MQRYGAEIGQAANTDADTANKNTAVSAFFMVFP